MPARHINECALRSTESTIAQSSPIRRAGAERHGQGKAAHGPELFEPIGARTSFARLGIAL